MFILWKNAKLLNANLSLKTIYILFNVRSFLMEMDSTDQCLFHFHFIAISFDVLKALGNEPLFQCF